MKYAEQDVVLHFAHEFFKEFMLVDNHRFLRLKPVKFGKRNVSTEAVSKAVCALLQTFGIEYERAGYLFYMGRSADTSRTSILHSRPSNGQIHHR